MRGGRKYKASSPTNLAPVSPSNAGSMALSPSGEKSPTLHDIKDGSYSPITTAKEVEVSAEIDRDHDNVKNDDHDDEGIPKSKSLTHTSGGDEEDEAEENKMTLESLNLRNTIENKLTIVEASSPNKMKSDINIKMDKAFYSSLLITKESELEKYPISEPLMAAVSSDEAIDVHIILGEMGKMGVQKVTGRDAYGRTPVHIAAMGANGQVIHHLMNTYRDVAQKKLMEELRALEREMKDSQEEIKNALKRSGKNIDRMDPSRVPQLRSVQEWYENEVLRLHRSLEIRVEINRAKVLATKDKFGRTPLHYAVACGCSASVMKALLKGGTANLNGKGNSRITMKNDRMRRSVSPSKSPSRGSPSRCGKKFTLDSFDDNDAISDRKWFDADAIYETTNGVEIGSSNMSTSAFAPSHLSKTTVSRQYNNSMADVRNVAWELGMAEGEGNDMTFEEEQTEVFDVMIPWIIRNMLKRVAEIGSREDTGGIIELERIVRDNCSEPSEVLIVPEVRKMLNRLGISATREVLQELCRRYPSDPGSISDKWDIVQNEQKEAKERARLRAAEKIRMKKLYGSDFKSSMMSESKGSSSPRENRGSKGSDRDDDRNAAKKSKYDEEQYRNLTVNLHASSKSGTHADDIADAKTGEDYGNSKADGKVNDDDVEGLDSTARESLEDMMILEMVDKDFGLNFTALVEDIQTGRAMKALYLGKSGEVTMTPLEKGIDNYCEGDEEKMKDMAELLEDPQSRHKDILSSTSTNNKTSTQAKLDMDHFRGKETMGFVSTHCPFVVPSCVSRHSITRARRSILDITDTFGRTPLLIASALGNREHVELLLANKADVSVCSLNGHSALSIANGESVRSLCEKAFLSWLNDKAGGSILGSERKLISVNSHSQRGNSGASMQDMHNMKEAAGARNTDKTLLNAASSTSQDARSQLVLGMRTHLKQLGLKNWSYSRPPLAWATHNGLVPVVQQLLLEKHDPNEVDSIGHTALHECVILVKEAKSVDLLRAAIEIADILAKAGADLNAMTVSHRTPLHELFCKSADEAASSFTKLPGSKTPFHVTDGGVDPILREKFRRVLLRSLLQWGADPLLADRHGMGVIHYAARENAAGCMVEILRQGIDGNFRSKMGKQTPLHYACKAGASQVANLLCRWDADKRPQESVKLIKDASGKLPVQLLPSTSSPRCLDTIWGLCLSGNANRVIELLNKMRMGTDAKWEDVDEISDFVNVMEDKIEDPFLKSDEKKPESDEVRKMEQKLDSEREEKKQEEYEDIVATQRDYYEEKQSKKKVTDWTPTELWLLDGADCKTRVMRWTPLHSCIIGWAIAEARGITSGDQDMFAPKPKPNRCAQRVLQLEEDKLSPRSSRSRSDGPLLHKEVTSILLDNHAFVDAVDINCRTPLMIAAMCNLNDAVTLLLQAGADVTAVDLEGNSALHLGTSDFLFYLLTFLFIFIALILTCMPSFPLFYNSLCLWLLHFYFSY